MIVICEECGKKIFEGRLKAMPFANLCVSCKSEREKFEVDRTKLHESDVYRKLAHTTIGEDD